MYGSRPAIIHTNLSALCWQVLIATAHIHTPCQMLEVIHENTRHMQIYFNMTMHIAGEVLHVHLEHLRELLAVLTFITNQD